MLASCTAAPVTTPESSLALTGTSYDVTATGSPTETWPVTKENAIAVAGREVPLRIAQKASISASYGWSVPGNEPGWIIHFSDIEISLNELGWQPILHKVNLEGGGPYFVIIVWIDGITGDLVSKSAVVAVR